MILVKNAQLKKEFFWDMQGFTATRGTGHLVVCELDNESKKQTTSRVKAFFWLKAWMKDVALFFNPILSQTVIAPCTFQEVYENTVNLGCSIWVIGSDSILRKCKLPIVVLDKLTGKIERNSPCPCGSGKKYKKCCL